jgi:CheY-like chemotaxis protein
MHGGEAVARSAGLGQGTEIQVRLPLSVAGPAPEPPTTEQRAVASNHRILLIDDRRDGILPLKKMLKMLGQEVETAENGKSGLEKARRFHPELVLCDIGLPDMNGYEVARAMRSDPTLRSTYLVAVTGYGQEEDRRNALEAGFDDHITKPVAKNQLESLLVTFPHLQLSFAAGGSLV